MDRQNRLHVWGCPNHMIPSLVLLVSARDVFKLMATKYKKSDLVASASFFEIYSGKVGQIRQQFRFKRFIN